MWSAFWLVIAAMIWGMGFVATKITLSYYSPLWSNVLRYFVSSLLFIPVIIYYKSYLRSIRELFYPFLASIFLFLTLILQTIGLETTTVAKSGFITSLYALFIPIIGMIYYKQKFAGLFWGLVFCALFGVYLLCDMEIDKFNQGDFYTLLCAFFAALHIIYIGLIARKYESAIELNSLQCLFMFFWSFLFGLFIEGIPSFEPLFKTDLDFLYLPITSFLFLGLFSSMIAFSIQVICQKKTPAHLAGLIFLLESPFAAIFGFLLLKESLTITAVSGCFVIMFAVGCSLFLRQK